MLSKSRYVLNNGKIIWVSVVNDTPFTRSDCVCDKQFGECLVRVGFRGAIVWGIYVRVVEQCIQYNNDNIALGTEILFNNFHRWFV